jgi:hypothetical protein
MQYTYDECIFIQLGLQEGKVREEEPGAGSHAAMTVFYLTCLPLDLYSIAMYGT